MTMTIIIIMTMIITTLYKNLQCLAYKCFRHWPYGFDHPRSASSCLYTTTPDQRDNCHDQHDQHQHQEHHDHQEYEFDRVLIILSRNVE